MPPLRVSQWLPIADTSTVNFPASLWIFMSEFSHYLGLPEMMPSQSNFSRDSFLDKYYNIFLPSLLAELLMC